MQLNSRIILHIMGLLLLVNGGFMLVAALVSLIYKDGATLDITLAAVSTMFSGMLLMFTQENTRKRYSVKRATLS